MSWFAILLFVIKEIPDLLTVFKAILELVRKIPPADRVQARTEISDAIQTKSNDEVRAVMKDWHHKCEGIACPSELKE